MLPLAFPPSPSPPPGLFLPLYPPAPSPPRSNSPSHSRVVKKSLPGPTIRSNTSGLFHSADIVFDLARICTKIINSGASSTRGTVDSRLGRVRTVLSRNSERSRKIKSEAALGSSLCPEAWCVLLCVSLDQAPMMFTLLW